MIISSSSKPESKTKAKFHSSIYKFRNSGKIWSSWTLIIKTTWQNSDRKWSSGAITILTQLKNSNLFPEQWPKSCRKRRRNPSKGKSSISPNPTDSSVNKFKCGSVSAQLSRTSTKTSGISWAKIKISADNLFLKKMSPKKKEWRKINPYSMMSTICSINSTKWKRPTVALNKSTDKKSKRCKKLSTIPLTNGNV